MTSDYPIPLALLQWTLRRMDVLLRGDKLTRSMRHNIVGTIDLLLLYFHMQYPKIAPCPGEGPHDLDMLSNIVWRFRNDGSPETLKAVEDFLDLAGMCFDAVQGPPEVDYLAG